MLLTHQITSGNASGTAEPYTHPKLSFETVYPGALDKSNVRQASDFYNLATSPATGSNLNVTEPSSISLTPAAWRASYGPDVSVWTDWALIHALIDNESSPDHGKLVGQCVVTKWHPASSGTILFVSQLLVHPEHRSGGVATGLLRAVADERPLINGVSTVGIAHPHAAAIRAVASVFGDGLVRVQADGKRVRGEEVQEILLGGSLNWLKDGELVEKIMDGQAETGTVVGVKTNRALDEVEIRRAAQKARDELGGEGWAFGEELSTGVEWLLLFRI